jgi:NDP-sugar pyrophosphorylase family protein
MSRLSLPIAILAGGLATRMRPLTETIPKSLLDVAGEPFVAHQLRLLARQGAREVVICAGYLGEQIEAFVGTGDRFGLSVRYSFDGHRLVGTGGALRRAVPLLGDAFLVLYGDSYLPCNFAAVEAAFLANPTALGLMTVYHNEGKFDRSNVEFDNGQIRRYDKKNVTPDMRYIDYGLGAFRRAAFDRVPGDQPYDLARLYQELLDQGQLMAVEIKERFYEIGSTAGLEELRSLLAAG